ncbi:MAG: hypothetical protein JJU41_04910 [Bacteroidetes bacterium]|nr:hypothetical protein [Bacteroidota bacterium]MCH8525232.1 hypothetical protein [Balneolales bacterium]
MYTIEPENTWATRFRIEKDGEAIGTIKSNGWSTSYTVHVSDDEVKLSSVKWYSSDLNIVRNDQIVGVTTSVAFSFSPEIQIQYKGKTFRIQGKSMMSRDFVIMLDDGSDGREIGTASKTGAFKTTYHIQLPDFIEPWFVGVIGALLIKQTNAAAATAAS